MLLFFCLFPLLFLFIEPFMNNFCLSFALEIIVLFVRFFLFPAEDGIRCGHVTGVQTCALPIYEPVLPVVRRGQQVQVGDRIGLLADRAGHCEPRSCLHWGLRQGDEYLDPLTLLGSPDAGQGPVRLLPLGDRTLTEEPPPAPSTPPPGDDSGDGDGSLSFPISPATVPSPFGTRVHPVTGVRKLHDGTDFGAGCGTPVTASAAGTVTGTGPRGAYGLQVAVAHPDIGAGLSTSYSHLSAIDVAPGAHVQRGQQVGRVGTTGMSTGCHLHFMVTVGGAAQDPMTWLG